MIADLHDISRSNIAYFETDRCIHEYTQEEGLRPVEAALVEKFFPQPPTAILDLGCGAGRTSIGFARMGYHVVAIDLCEALLFEARRRYPDLDFRSMDATHLEFPDSAFDAAVFSYNGIDNVYPLSARIRCLTEVFRVLRSGGVFLLSSHNLVGSIFSAGYFSLTGYRNAAKLLADQLTNPVALQWYVRYRNDGPQLLYSAPPGYTVRQLEGCGFRVLDVCGYNGERRPRALRMHHQHVHFVVEKSRQP
jgi:SAM-dependent methyltransferase